MEGKIHLSDGEWKLMNLLWDRAPQTITELIRALASDTGWSKHTVIKMLSRTNFLFREIYPNIRKNKK